MIENMHVDPNELIKTAIQHEHLSKEWEKIAHNPPNNPDELSKALGHVGHQFIQTLKHHNNTRTTNAINIANAHTQLAQDLRQSAADYLNIDQQESENTHTIHFD